MMDEKRLEQFQLRVFQEVGTCLAGVLMYIGDRAGLFRAMAGRPPMTADELAREAGLQERYVREWLSAMAAREIVEYDGVADRFSLPAEHAAVLADENGAVFTGSWFASLPSFHATLPSLIEAFRKGGGVPFSAFGPEFVDAFSRFRRVVFNHHLVQNWLPLVPDVMKGLNEGVTVADVACGIGQATLVLARAFPKSRFVGFDADQESIERAVANARASGVEDRAEFRRQSLDESIGAAAFELALMFDCVHDLADPGRGLRHVKNALKPGGIALIQELNVGDRLTDNLNPFGGFFYTVSTLHCLTASLARGGAGLGTAMAPSVLRQLVLDAGFRSLERLPLKHPLYALYAARA